MRRAGLLLLLSMGCGEPGGVAPAPPPVGLTLSTPSAHVDAGQPVLVEVTARTSSGWSLTPEAPISQGLTVTAQGHEGPLLSGGQQLETWRYALEGKNGSYVVTLPPASAAGPEGQAQEPTVGPLFVDIGVSGPTGGPMEDLLAAPPPRELPWGLILAAGLVALVIGGIGTWLWMRSRRPAPPPPPLAPEVRAREAWEAARARGLADHPLALALSHIFRELLEEREAYPALARTSREILGWMEAENILPVAARSHAARILDATDLLKVAREGGGEPFFAALDEDFEAVLATLRPRGMSPVEEQEGADV